MNKKEIIEQITHILSLNKFEDNEIKPILESINNLIESEDSKILKQIRKDYEYHKQDAIVHLEKYKQNKSKTQYNKHLRHKFICGYIEWRLEWSNQFKLFKIYDTDNSRDNIRGLVFQNGR